MSFTDAILTAFARARVDVDFHYGPEYRGLMIDAEIKAANGQRFCQQVVVDIREIEDSRESAVAQALERIARAFIYNGLLPDNSIPGVVSRKTRERERHQWQRERWANDVGHRLRERDDSRNHLYRFDRSLEDFLPRVVALLVEDYHETEQSARALVETAPAPVIVSAIVCGCARTACHLLLQSRPAPDPAPSEVPSE